MNRTLLGVRGVIQAFWFIPTVMTLVALALAELGISLEERLGVPPQLSFVYGGGEAGARSVLAAIAASAIGVAGTVFSVTIAALSFTAASMGPRLLDNFTRDRGNQVTLGVFIATFAFSLYTLRVVRGVDESPFVPNYNVTGALGLSLACIAALVFFIMHVTATINITHVVNLLRDDLEDALDSVTREAAQLPRPVPLPPQTFWSGAEELRAPGGGYLQAVDVSGLVRLARRENVTLHLLARPGEYVFPHAPLVRGVPRVPPEVRRFLILGRQRTTKQDVEYAARQLSDVAVRALSPGVNDPITAMDVLDRFGDALCRLAGRGWTGGLHRDGHGTLRVVRPVAGLAELTGAMFDLIRHYGKDSPAVMLRLLEVLTAAAAALPDPASRAELHRHAELAYSDACDTSPNAADRLALRERYRHFQATLLSSGTSSGP